MDDLQSKLSRNDATDWLEIWDEWQDIADESLVELSYLAYYVWQRQNKVVFKAWCRLKYQVVAFASSAALDYGEYAKHIYCGTSPVALHWTKKWQVLPVGCVKVNVDASFTNDGWVGMGVVVRDEHGEVILAGCVLY